MPTEALQSEVALLSELGAALSPEHQYLDLCLSFRQKTGPKKGGEILRVGGRWDRTNRRYTDEDPNDLRAVVIWVNENQVPAVVEFGGVIWAQRITRVVVICAGLV